MKSSLSHIYILVFLLLISLVSFSQSVNYTGQVFDQKTQMPLPFVNVVYDAEHHLGTITDIDGRFSINTQKTITDIEFSCLGYQNKHLKVQPNNTQLKVYLQAQTFMLSEVEVYGQENPAHRIINLAIRNRKKNKPESLSAYQYETYNKMYFTFDAHLYRGSDTIALDDYQFGTRLSHQDSLIKEMTELKNSQYLFLMESVSEKKYKRPGRINEKVLATKVSGLKSPTFALLGTQMQSFTIYTDYIHVGEKRYLSPLSKNSPSNYLFIITDTLIHPSSDTTYTLSYQPRKGKQFDGLEGVLQINTKGFAVQNFSTKPTKQSSYTLTIRQKYEFLKDSAWFPTQLDADFIFPDVLGEIMGSNAQSPDNVILLGKAKTYIRNVDLSPVLKNKEFSYVAYEITEEAGDKSEAFWNQYRADSITAKEQKTYQVVDSLGQEMGFEDKLKFLSYLVNGKVPIGVVSLQLDKLMDMSVAEGFRLGLGLESNEKLSKVFKMNGYGAYGFGDKKWKYGAGVSFNVRDHYDSYFNLAYQKDVIEVGAIPYINNQSFLNRLNYRAFLIKNIVYEESLSAALALRFFYYLKAEVYGKYARHHFYQDNYRMQKGDEQYTYFEMPEVGVRLRYAFREYYMRTQFGVRPLKTDYPILYFNIAKNVPVTSYPLSYTKIWGKLEKDFLIRNGDVISLNLQMGYAWGDLPYYKLFNGQGSNAPPYSILAHNSFGAMNFNEFASDKFTYLFLRYHFAKQFYKTSWSAPELSLLQNIGWSACAHPEYHLGIPIKTMNKGYFESGLVLDNLIKWDYLRYGLGVYYRYGAYAFDKPIKNFAFKISLGYAL